MKRSLAIATGLVWLPLGLGLLGMGVADLLGCAVDEGSAHACLVAGVDVGFLLYALFMMGWLMVILAPFMLVTAVIWLVLGVQWCWRRFR